MVKKITILIPVFNEIFYTKKCLKNLNTVITTYYKKKTKPSCFKIIIIDDGSTDGTSDWVERHYPEIKIIKGDGSLFWSKAINLGIEYSQQLANISHILFWNKDLYVEDDYLSRLHDHISSEPSQVIIASKMYRKSTPKILFSYGGLYNYNTGKKKNIGSGELDCENYNHKMEIDWCGGMAVCIPFEVFNKIGGCDGSNFPQYDGDTDFFLRAKKAGFKLFVFPDLKAWNIHENTGKKTNFSLKSYLWHINDIRSFQNFKIGFRLIKKHSQGVLPYINLILYYALFTIKYFTKILFSYFR